MNMPLKGSVKGSANPPFNSPLTPYSLSLSLSELPTPRSSIAGMGHPPSHRHLRNARERTEWDGVIHP